MPTKSVDKSSGRIVIFQISDIHATEKTPLAERMVQAAQALTRHVENSDQVLVFITGDLAFSGRKHEYSVVTTAILKLKTELVRLGASEVGIYSVPGNHDRDHSLMDEALLNSLVETVSNGSSSGPIIQILNQPHKHYFESETILEPEFTFNSDSVSKKVNIDSVIGKLSIVGLNTAFCAKKRDDPGNIDLGLTQPLPDEADVSILLMHHPTAWMTVASRKHFQREVAPRFGLIFTGHEHSGDTFDVARSDGRSSKFIEGGVFFEHNPGHSSFNVVEISKDEEEKSFLYSVSSYRLTDSGFEVETESQPRRVPQGHFGHRWNELNDSFRDFLESDGDAIMGSMVLSGRRTDNLRIDRRLSPSTILKTDLGPRLSGELLQSPGKVLIFGEEKSGKTTLAKIIYLQAYIRGELPLYIDAEKIQAINDGSFSAHLDRLIQDQYRDLTPTKYFEAPREKRIAVLDNHHVVATHGKRHDLLSSALNSHFASVVSLVDSTLMSGSLFAHGSDAFVEYERFELLPLDRPQVRRLTRLWCKGDSGLVNEVKADILFRAVDSVLADPIIPSYPFFVLSLLAQAESGQALRAGTSTQGYLYENMLTSSIIGAVAKEKLIDVENVIQYASALSVICYDANDIGLETSDLQDFHRQHADKWGLAIDYRRMIDVLIRASIISESGDRFEFKYKFCMYYFVGRHIAEAFEDPANANRLDELVDQLHAEHGANIVAFAAHRAGESNKRDIVDKIVQSTNGIFRSRPRSTLRADLKGHFGSSRIDTPLEAKPSTEDEVGIGATTADKAKPKPPSKTPDSLANEYLRGIRSLSIVGQIVRGFQGKLQADEKQRLIEAAVGLTLRTVGDIEERILATSSDAEFDVIADDVVAAWESGNLVPESFKEEWAKTRSPEARRKFVKEKIAASLVSISEVSLSALFRHTSRALGSPQTNAIFNQYLQKEAKNLGPGMDRAMQFLLLSNRIEFSSEMPDEQIVRLHASFKKDGNDFGADLVRRLIWLRLMTTAPEYSAVQRICSQIGIDYHSPRMKQLRHRQIAAAVDREGE